MATEPVTDRKAGAAEESPSRCAAAIGVGIAACVLQIVVLFLLVKSHGVEYVIRGPVVASVSFYKFVLYGAALHTIIALFRKNVRTYWKQTFFDARWLGLTALMTVDLGLLSYFYQGLKTGVWLMGRQSVDPLLWTLDRWLLFGMSPNVFFLNLFQGSFLLTVFDIGYGHFFLVILVFGISFFLAMPGVSRKTSFILANTLLWSIGAWLYFMVPAMGPAYGYNDVWEEARPSMPATTYLQRRVMENHLNILTRTAGYEAAHIHFAEGLGAFPSLHVGFFALLALFVRRESRRGGNWLFGATAFMFIGSMVTGWHYMIDAVMGLLLAWLCYRLILRLEFLWAPLIPAEVGE